jgi:hypothetical protein
MAASLVKSGHNVYDNDEAVAKVLRILREHGMYFLAPLA